MDTSNFDPVPERLHGSDSDSESESEGGGSEAAYDEFLGRPPSSAASDPDGTPSSTSSRAEKRQNRFKNALDQDPKHAAQHAFLEFTFRRFFDNTGNAYPIRFGSSLASTAAAETVSFNSDVDGDSDVPMKEATSNGGFFEAGEVSPTTHLEGNCTSAQHLYGSIAESVRNENSAKALTITPTTGNTFTNTSTTIATNSSSHHEENLYIYDEVSPEMTSLSSSALPTITCNSITSSSSSTVVNVSKHYSSTTLETSTSTLLTSPLNVLVKTSTPPQSISSSITTKSSPGSTAEADNDPVYV